MKIKIPIVTPTTFVEKKIDLNILAMDRLQLSDLFEENESVLIDLGHGYFLQFDENGVRNRTEEEIAEEYQNHKFRNSAIEIDELTTRQVKLIVIAERAVDMARPLPVYFLYWD